MNFSPGTLVSARGREWVVLPESVDDLLMLRPLGGTDLEITGILPELEEVKAASFDLPDPSKLGDYRSARMLRDALRLGFRSSAGPFRSIAKVAVEPRPYQLVPLLMALKLDPVRLLIADDVGIGKTIESGLIAKELLEQGDAKKLAVLCPPHLAEQWQSELATKFHIEAELVLASTAARLERPLSVGQSIFDVYDHVIVSMDFIKSDRRRDDFIRACPDLVIVDEAHTCADSGEGKSSRHQRNSLVQALSDDPDRHIILVTATPHSGKDGSFRSLLALLGPQFADLPESLAGNEFRGRREELALHLVQRRRADIQRFLEHDTSFPTRLESELTYTLSPEYAQLFNDVLDYARASVNDKTTGARQQRVRWWSALGLLRAMASSPAAAAATMRTRAATADADTEDDVNEIGRLTVLDLDEAEHVVDVVPGVFDESADGGIGRRLRELAKAADAVAGDKDEKLVRLVTMIKQQINDGHQPIVFCRFIETAEYVAKELRARLPKKLGAEVEAVTGRVPSSDREVRIASLGEHATRILVATDCLSEGINLQDAFTTVIHYDLPWNPTRLEQREGRVDRFGQASPEVRVITYYGADNQIDETVLEVLLRKHKAIRGALGVSIPIPGNTGTVIEALAESMLLRSDSPIEDRLPGFDEYLRPVTEQLHLEWDAAQGRASRSVFAQNTIDPNEVAQELKAMQAAIGSGVDVETFMVETLSVYQAKIAKTAKSISVDLGETPRDVRDALSVPGDDAKVEIRFDLPVGDGVVAMSRTHPSVAGLAGHVLDTALDPVLDSPAARCGVMRTGAVTTRTTLLLCRYRVKLRSQSQRGDHAMLAEEAALLGFTGSPENPTWLSQEETEALLGATPSGQVTREVAADFMQEVLDAEPSWRSHLEIQAAERAAEVAEVHGRVRQADRRRTGRRNLATVTATAQVPVDVVGMFQYLPGTVS